MLFTRIYFRDNKRRYIVFFVINTRISVIEVNI